MPSRKVRRRRAKLQRHEYEYVVETDEGEEVPLERAPGRERAADGRAGREDGPLDRRGRPLPKPTWQRSLRRTAMFAPFIAIFIYVMDSDLPLLGVAFNTVLILAFFLPFSYFTDRLIYNALLRRQQRARR
jgi:hypothetical protein